MTAHVAQAVEWIRDEQVNLWSDLEIAIRTSRNRTWSISASWFATRIVGAARLVGPTPFEDVPWVLLAGGVYEALLTAGQLTPDLPGEDLWREMEQRMAEQGTRAELRPRFAGTLAAIADPREQRQLMDGRV